jgi:hypothetical protein
MPSQGPAAGSSLFPATPPHEVSVPASLPHGRPLPALLLPARHLTPPRAASRARTAPPSTSPVAEGKAGGSLRLRLGRPMPATRAYAPIHLAPLGGRGGLHHRSSPPRRTHVGKHYVFKYFRRFRLMFQVFHLYVTKVDLGCCICCKCNIRMFASLCFRCFRRLFQMFHLYVLKVDHDIAHVAMATHACFKCFRLMLQMFHLDISKVYRVL